MRWFFRKRPAAQHVPPPVPPGPAAFHCVVVVGDTESDRTVSGALMDQLVEATKKPALDALDRHFGTERWCSEINTNASLQGPSIYFNLDLTVQPGETMNSMAHRVADEFRRRWDTAAQSLLA